MLFSLFTVSVGHKIQPRTVAVGFFDGKHPCLVGATSNGKVFIHNPHYKVEGGNKILPGTDSDISLLNINQNITSVACGKLDPFSSKDILFVGTQTNLMAYDVYKNSDIFYKETPDGANAIVIGKLGSIKKPLAIVGGNCSIQGFNHEGDDEFWTVTGDNVCSMTMLDFSGNGENELIVGSEDFDIRVFREDEIIEEMCETETIVALCSMTGNRFGYALANGTVGVYEKNGRFWRIKSRNMPLCIYGADVDGDGNLELVTGWSNGKIDVRSDRTGEVIFKETLTSPVVSIVEADYQLNGRKILICCTDDGLIKGYRCATAEEPIKVAVTAQVEQEAVRELSQRKQNLILELKNYEENQKAATMARPSGLGGDLDQKRMGIIPSNTQLQTTLTLNTTSHCVELIVGTTNDTVIRSVLIFAEGIFEGESFVCHPHYSNLSNSLAIPLSPPKDVPVDLHIKAFVGHKNSQQYHVFELTRQLPRFSMYALESNDVHHIPKSSVTFVVKDRIARVVMWINQNFLLSEDYATKGDLNIKFFCLRTQKSMVMTMDSSGNFKLLVDSMELAGDIIQSMTNYLNISQLSSVADFPDEMKLLADLLNKIDEYQSARQRLSADMADNSNLVKGLIVKAEDSRQIGSMKSMRRAYMDLNHLNREMIANYKIRSGNHIELVKCLKNVNQYIQKASRLRVGTFQADVISGCRQAIKTNNHSAFFKVIETGTS